MPKFSIYVLVLFTSALFINLAYYRLVVIKEVKKDIDKFRLYALRDRFIEFLTEGKLSYNDVVFQTFYKITNDTVAITDQLTFKTLVQAARMSHEELEGASQVFNELEHRDESVKKAVQEYIETVLEIMLHNSFLLRLALWATGAGFKFLPKITQFSRYCVNRVGFFELQKEAYKAYSGHKQYEAKILAA